MSRSRIQELAMKIVDVDETPPDREAPLDVSGDADTQVSPGLRPEVLGDAAQRRTKAMVHAALFAGTGEAPTIGPYQVLKRLGEGGMGVVYAAYDDKLDRKVALKLLRGAMIRHPEARARTLREARALARLSHPNVVHVYQVGEVDDEIFVAMEFLTGPTLRAWLGAKPRTWREVLAVFRQAGDGLAAAHRQGVIHRDFKPANVLVGDDGRVRVLDFGLAHFGDDGEAIKALPTAGEVDDVLLTQTGAVLGTPAYMAAEQFAGARGDARTDQFSFCTALYEALHGQRPFAGDTLTTLVPAVTAGRIQPVKTDRVVPAWLHRVVLRGLQPDPAARWPSMDALLAALSPPQARWGRVAAVAASTAALLAGGIGYAALRSSADDARFAAEREAAAQARAEAIRSQDEKALTEARAALTRDPVETIRALTRLAGDDPATWHAARFLTTAAHARGLPQQVLRAGDHPLAEVQPLAGGGLVGRDELGAVWRWDMSARTGTEVLPAGAAARLLVASRAPTWAAVGEGSVQVFAGDRTQTIDTGMITSFVSDWRLSSDGRTLVASVWMRPNPEGLGGSTHLWDLERPGSPPQTIALPPETLSVTSVDASVLAYTDAEGLHVVRPREGAAKTLPYRGAPRGLSADGRFAVAWAADKEGAQDVIELATGTVRQVKADNLVLLDGADTLFMRPLGSQVLIWRESLATGAVAWTLLVPAQGALEQRLVVDPVHEQFAVTIGDEWGIGDLRRGELTSYMTVPKDRRPQWAGAGALAIALRDEVRLHRPATAPVQAREQAWDCALAPGGRWAAVLPWDVDHEEFSRIELATGAKRSFRCPTRPTTVDLGGKYESYTASSAVDDAGQVAMIGKDGWSCWWDEQHGARPGARAPAFGWLVGLPRGAAMVAGSEVEVWSGPEERTQRWTAAGQVTDLQASPSGASLAVRSDRGVQVLRDTGEVVPVITAATPAAERDVLAGALAWSPDGARLAALNKVDGALELEVWDVAAEPREVGRYDLKDSQGRPRNRVTFTPTGAAVALTDRRGSVLRIDLASREARRIELPDLHTLHMRGETDAIGIDVKYRPHLIDFAAGEASPLTPDVAFGGSTKPRMRRAESGSLWTCAALGPGTLLEIASSAGPGPEDMRARLRDLAAAL